MTTDNDYSLASNKKGQAENPLDLLYIEKNGLITEDLLS